MNTFGNRLKQWALEKYGSIGKLCAVTGIQGPQLSRYMSGTTRPGLDVLERLAVAGADLNWLVIGSVVDLDNAEVRGFKVVGVENVPPERILADLMLLQFREAIARYRKETSDEFWTEI